MEDAKGALGLNLLYEPSETYLDLVFVSVFLGSKACHQFPLTFLLLGAWLERGIP